MLQRFLVLDNLSADLSERALVSGEETFEVAPCVFLR